MNLPRVQDLSMNLCRYMQMHPSASLVILLFGFVFVLCVLFVVFVVFVQ